MPSLIQTDCPECEGVGLSVNYFRPARSVFDDDDSLQSMIPPERTTSHGFFFTDRPCYRCNGQGRVFRIVASRPACEAKA